MPKWWEVRSANTTPTFNPVSVELAQIEQSRKQVIEKQEIRAAEGKGSFLSNLGKAALSPVKAAGKQTLEWLEDYERRFVAPTAVWAIDQLSEINRTLPTVNPGNIVQEGPVFSRGKTLFGTDLTDIPSVNPLAAYNGDDEEIEKAYNYFTNLPLAEQLTYGLVFDPTSWLTIGVGGTAKLFTKGGLKMLGQSGEMAKSLESLTSARTVQSKLRASGGKSLLGVDGELDNLIKGLNVSRKAKGQAAIGLDQESAARAMIGAASMMNFIVGTPEIMLDSFLRGAMRPIGKIPFMPRLSLEEIDGAPRLRVRLVGIGERAARTNLDMAFRDTQSLVSGVKLRAASELGENAGDFRQFDEKVIEILQRTDLDFPDEMAARAYKSIHNTDGVDLNKFSTMVDDNMPLDWVMRTLGEDIFNARVAEFGIGTKDMAKKVKGFTVGFAGGKKWDIDSPGMARVASRIAGLPEGRRFFRNKLAATWMHGVLFSPFYIIQQPMTNMMNSGMKTSLSTANARIAYGNGPSALYDTFLDRTGILNRLELNDPKMIDDIGDALKAEAMFGITEYGSMSMMAGDRRLASGYLVEGMDKIGDAFKNIPGGKAVADGMKGVTRVPRALAQANDESAFRSVYEHYMGTEITRRIATNPDPTVAAVYGESQDIYKNLRAAGVSQAESKAVSMRYMTATSEDDFMDGLRQVSKMGFAEKMGLISQSGQSMRPQWLHELLKANAAISGGGRERFVKGQDRIFRLEYPNQIRDTMMDTREWNRGGLVAQIESEGNPSFTLYHNNQMDILDDLEDNSVFPNMVFSTQDLPTDIASLRKIKTPRGNDVKLWTDVALRQSSARAAHNRFMANSIAAYKENPVKFMKRWNGTERVRNQGMQSFGVHQKTFFDDVARVRKEFIDTGGQSRKEWGNFRTKWEAQADLIDEPDMDLLDGFVRNRQNDGHYYCQNLRRYDDQVLIIRRDRSPYPGLIDTSVRCYGIRNNKLLTGTCSRMNNCSKAVIFIIFGKFGGIRKIALSQSVSATVRRSLGRN